MKPPQKFSPGAKFLFIDPRRPDPPENFKIPASPTLSEVKPPGN